MLRSEFRGHFQHLIFPDADREILDIVDRLAVRNTDGIVRADENSLYPPRQRREQKSFDAFDQNGRLSGASFPSFSRKR